MVDGAKVYLTPEEAEALRAEWAAAEAEALEKQQADEDERLRLQNLRGDALAAELLDKLTNATPTQMGDYVDNRVTDLPSARTMLKRILLVMALIAKDQRASA